MKESKDHSITLDVTPGNLTTPAEARETPSARGSGPRQGQWVLHFSMLAILAIAVGLIALREPGTGDDLTYWLIAFNLHDKGLDGWIQGSFHNLRWPVWGVCWALQALFGFNLTAYSGTGLFYFAAGTLLCAAFGRLLFRSIAAAGACGIAYMFHPLLDTLCTRPMPDAAEGIWGGCAMLCWWGLMNAGTRKRAIAMALLTGLLVFVAQANRLTGVFVIPILGVCTLLFFRARFGWLVLAGVLSASFYGLECWFYHERFGDWFYNLHTNMLGKGVAGTEPVPLWYLPFRFVRPLWDTNSPLSPVYTSLALAGAWAAWSGLATNTVSHRAPSSPSNHGVLARVLVVWLILLYLEYACAPQSLSPWRPVVRAGNRFLASLAVPMSILSVCSLAALLTLVKTYRPDFARLLFAFRLPVGAAIVVVLAIVSVEPRREFSDERYLSAMRDYLRSTPPGTKIYTHAEMRAVAHLAEESAARGFEWLVSAYPMHGTRANEKLIANADEHWHLRKHLWMGTHQLSTIKNGAISPASCFGEARDAWEMTAALDIGEASDLNFFRRRLTGTPEPVILDANAPELARLIAALDVEMTEQLNKKKPAKIRWDVPPALRGKFVRLELQGRCKNPRPVRLQCVFRDDDGKNIAEHLLVPNILPGFPDALGVRIPDSAKTCSLDLRLDRKAAKDLEISSFRAILEP